MDVITYKNIEDEGLSTKNQLRKAEKEYLVVVLCICLMAEKAGHNVDPVPRAVRASRTTILGEKISTLKDFLAKDFSFFAQNIHTTPTFDLRLLAVQPATSISSTIPMTTKYWLQIWFL